MIIIAIPQNIQKDQISLTSEMNTWERAGVEDVLTFEKTL